MEPDEKKAVPIKSALFVDFDNIFIGLSKSDPLAAERFASDPARWLAWLEKCLPGSPRSILVRRCYPNPDAGFRRFRSFFTSSAFTVIDCPSLTRTGKNSSDIYMVMDILDILNHKTFFDEFIIFSGDSDFMPVLLRLRAHDRRTTTLAIDFMPPAYKAACDLVISEEEFIEGALGVTHENGAGLANAARARVAQPLLQEMASRLYQTTLHAGEVAGADLPDILKDFREFRDSTNWLGFGTSQRLAEALAGCEPRLNLVRLNPAMYKMVLKTPGGEELPPEENRQPAAAHHFVSIQAAHLPVSKAEKGNRPPDRQPGVEPGSNGGEKPIKADLNRLRGQILSIVKEIVAGSSIPVLLARASQVVVNRLGPQVLDTQWAGAGSFKRLLQSADEVDFEITTLPEPGYIFDPKRHAHPARERMAGAGSEPAVLVEPPGEASNEAGKDQMPPDGLVSKAIGEDDAEQYEDEDLDEEEYREQLPSLEEFIRRVSRVTGAPDLTPRQYAQAFRGIIVELQQVAAGEKAYNTYQSSKSISEWCSEQGTPVSRSDMVLILKGIIYQDGVRFSKRPGSYTEKELAGVVLRNIKALCRRARLELSEYELHLLEDWILCGLDESGAESNPDAAHENF